MSVVVLGSANIDLVYRVERIPGGGETVLASGSAEHAGGKGNNQAIAARRAGAQVGFVGALGSDERGDRLAALLAGASVETSLRRTDEPTGTAVITVDDTGENAIVVNQGANGRFLDLDHSERSLVRAADFLLLQLEIPIATVVDAASDAHANGVSVVLNAAPVRELPDELTDNVDILIVNEHEALALASRVAPNAVLPRVITVDDARDIVAILLRIVPAVVVTLGSNGSVVLTRDMGDSPAAHVPSPAATVVDTTGAGDTFCGALVAELDAGADLIEAAQFASIAGALAVQGEGAVPSIPTRRQIMHARREYSLP